MSDFLKQFLREDPRRFSPDGRYVALAAFGKHPGWDDHVEPRDGQEARDLGLETDSLNLAKTALYVNGIGGQIDSGVWDKLDAAQQLPAFKHVFVWQRSGQFLIGRLWSSSDGKGRTRYPMVVCLHFAGVTLGWALKQALPALAELEEGCVRTGSAAEVRSLLVRHRAALRAAIQSTDGRGEYAPVTPESLHKILQPGGETKSEGFLRVLYQIQSQFSAFVTGKFKTGSTTVMSRAQQIRVQAAGDNPEQALLFWTRFFLEVLDPSVPLLLIMPLEGDWLDVTVGEPASHEFFCLRASPKAVPRVSEVPYKLDDAFRAKATAYLKSFQHGETTATDLRPASAPARDASAPPKGGWKKWLGGGTVVILGAVATMLLLPKSQEPIAGPNPSRTKPPTAPPLAKAEVPASAPGATGTVKVAAAREKARRDDQVETARLAEESKRSNATAAAAKLKAEAEAAARERELKERERQMAEATRLKKEQEAAKQKELEEQQRKAAEAKTKAEEQARTKVDVAAASVASAGDSKPAATSAPSAPPAGDEMTNTIGMALVRLRSGLWVGKHEITQAEYQKVMKNNPSKSVNDAQPVEGVTWNEANDFCRRLTEMERDKWAGRIYSLPTQKQWKEFAGRQRFENLPGGGLAGRWRGPKPVGRSAPANEFGLFDVLGNVWEWCLDGGGSAGEKLLQGGAFNSTNYTRMLPPDKQMWDCGFRCVLAGP